MIETISFLGDPSTTRYFESIFEKRYEEVEETEKYVEKVRQEIKICEEKKEREEGADVLGSLLKNLLCAQKK